MQTLLSRGFGFLLLGLLLIAFGMVMVLSLTFEGMNQILGIMAIIAGFLILIGR